MVRVKFLGSAGNVTGSRFLLRYSSKNILVDCGLFQERHYRFRNWDEFPVDPGSIDAVLFTTPTSTTAATFPGC